MKTKWWDPFSRCRGEGALDSENDDPCNDMIASSTAANDYRGDGCVETAIDGVMSILRGLFSSSKGSSFGEENDQPQTEEGEVATTQHMEPTSTCKGSCSDDKIKESDSDPADNIGLLSPSKGSSSGEEECQAQAHEAVEVVTTHHMEPTSTCNCSCLDDKIKESNSEPVDDKILVVMEPQSEYDIPNIADEEEALHTDPTEATSLNVANRSVKEDVDAALSWFVLSGILGSPAPSSVVKHHGRKNDIALFWDLEEGIIRGDFDDIPDIQEDSIDTQEDSIDTFKGEDGADPLNDTCTTASLLSESDYDSEADLCIVPDIDDVEQFGGNDKSPQRSVKKVADSALAWGALAMILNAPAPSAVAATSCSTKNLFEDDELTVDLDDVVLSL